jgi:release factor glutamine methyltransferase
MPLFMQRDKSMTIKEVVRKYSNDLKTVTHIPKKEVEMLVMHLLKQNVIWLHLNYDKPFEHEKELEKLVQKRSTHYPLEYIIQKVSFYGELFDIVPGVLIPRPETELLIDGVLEQLKAIKKPKRVLEIGVGSGVIGIMLALLVEDITLVGVDINDKALELAKNNAKKLGVEDKITFVKSNLFENVTSEFDMVVSNPPYIASNYILPKNVEFEPKNALFSGQKGDELLKQIIAQTSSRNIAYLSCEMGYDQRQIIQEYLHGFDVKAVEFYKDYAGFDRGFHLVFKTPSK